MSIALGAGKTVGTPPVTALFVGVSGGTYNVSGSGGSVSAIGYTASGGTPPYFLSTSMGSNPSGKLAIGSADGNPSGRVDAYWSSFAINESQGGQFNVTVTDSVGASYTGTSFTTIKRTS